MKTSIATCAALIFISGPVSAAPRDFNFHSKLDLPLYTIEKSAYRPEGRLPLYIGSDKSYAFESKEVRIAGRSLTLGLALAGLLQPLGPVAAIGFLLVSAYNAKALASELTSKPARPSGWSFLFHKNQ